MDKELQEYRSEDGMIRTGFKKLDRLIGIENLNRNNLICLASRPEMGMTTLATDIALNAAMASGKIIYFFSLALSKDWFITRLARRLCGASTDYINIDDDTFITAKQILEHFPIIIDDEIGITPDYIEEKLSTVDNLGAVIIDYLQLMSYPQDGGMTRNDEMLHLLGFLSHLSKKHSIPVITLAALGRYRYGRTGRSISRSVRNAGLMIPEIDTILGLYRRAEKKDTVDDRAELTVLKNRFGECGSILLSFDKERLKFEEYLD